MSNFLRAQSISHSYGNLPVLSEVSVEVNPGEFVAIVGPSGCGKTTFLKILGGLLRPSAGHVRVDELSVEEVARSRLFGFVFQRPTLLPWRTVLENVNLPLEIIGSGNRSGRPAELLRLLGLAGFEGFYPYELSGGMQQRVAIARSLVYDPAILLMDEPFAAIDELSRERLNEELLRLWDHTGKTIVFITHSLAEAVYLADRIVVLSERPARVAAVCRVQLPRPRTRETRYSSQFIETVHSVRELLHV